MRPHVELVDERDLIWHPAELPHGVGAARQRHLSYCEETGAASLLLQVDTDWQRPAGRPAAQTQLYLLDGGGRAGDDALQPGDFLHAAAGQRLPALHLQAGSRLLLFRDFGDWGFRPEPGASEALLMRSAAMDWYPVTHPTHGSPMDFERGGTPEPGLHIKLLFHDPVSGFYTRLIRAEPNWREAPLAHHPCFEEAYCLQGRFDYNFGPMWPGTYFFRPAGVRHGDFRAGPEGTTWLVRCDGRLVDWYTDDARLQLQGRPRNWGDGFAQAEAPRLPEPLRSRSIGPMPDPGHR